MSSNKITASIRIDAELLKQLKDDAQASNRSLSKYVESLLYRLGYRPYNEETAQACQEAQAGASAGEVDATSFETFVATAFYEED